MVKAKAGVRLDADGFALLQCIGDRGNITETVYFGGYDYDSTSIRRPFDCLSKVIKVTVT